MIRYKRIHSISGVHKKERGGIQALYKVSEKKLYKLQTEEAKFALCLHEHEHLAQNYQLNCSKHRAFS